MAIKKFDPRAMSAAADKDAAAELEKLEARVNQLGGQIIGPLESIIDSVKLDDTDPVGVQIDKTRRIIAGLEPLAAAVQAVVRGNEPRRRRSRDDDAHRPDPRTTPDDSPSEPGKPKWTDTAREKARSLFADDDEK